MMQVIGGWTWSKFITPQTLSKKAGVIVKVEDIRLRNPPIDFNKYCTHPLVFITGDGDTLADDVKEFESWGIPHDLYCVNRSLIFFERQVDHWAAVDTEEGMWFSQNVNDKVERGRRILRHTIGDFPEAYDCFWEMVYEFDNDYQRRIFVGNTGYFAVLSALNMGYKKIVLAGMPLNHGGHFYEEKKPENVVNWTGLTYTQWMDFKMKRPDAESVRSMSGYSGFILGKATKEWASVNG